MAKQYFRRIRFLPKNFKEKNCLEMSEEGESGSQTEPRQAQYAIHSGPDGQGQTFTVEEAVEKTGFGKFQWRLSILTGMAWMADAMEVNSRSSIGRFLGPLKTSKTLHAIFLHVIHTEIWRCLYETKIKFRHLVALFQWPKYKNSISTTFRALKWRHQVAILNLFFIEASLNFLLYHMHFLHIISYKHFLHIFIPKKVAKFMS